MSGLPPPFDHPPMNPQTLETTVVLAIAAAKLLLGEAKTREIISRAMGDPPSITLGP
jgi:hypothetical protein